MNDSRCSMVSTTTRRSVPLFIAAGLGISLGLAPVVAPPSAFGNEITTTTEVESAAFNVSSAEELQQAFDTIMSDEYQGKGTIRLTQNIEVTSPIRVHVGNIVQPRITIEGNNNTITFDCAVSEAPIEVAWIDQATFGREIILTFTDVHFSNSGSQQGGYAATFESGNYATFTHCTFSNLHSAVLEQSDYSDYGRISITNCTYDNTLWGFSIPLDTNSEGIPIVNFKDNKMSDGAEAPEGEHDDN